MDRIQTTRRVTRRKKNVAHLIKEAVSDVVFVFVCIIEYTMQMLTQSKKLRRFLVSALAIAYIVAAIYVSNTYFADDIDSQGAVTFTMLIAVAVIAAQFVNVNEDWED